MFKCPIYATCIKLFTCIKHDQFFKMKNLNHAKLINEMFKINQTLRDVYLSL